LSFPFSRILIGPEAVSGLTTRLKKMRFVELFVREVATFVASIGMGLQKRKNIMKRWPFSIVVQQSYRVAVLLVQPSPSAHAII
jgi:hypothetical protein